MLAAAGTRLRGGGVMDTNQVLELLEVIGIWVLVVLFLVGRRL